MQTAWLTPESLPPLREGSAQLWRITLDEVLGPEPADRANALGPWLDLLTLPERARAARYRVDRAREQFAVGRAALRILLGHHLGLAALSVELGEGPHGKPRLEDEPALNFNVAHSHGLILIGLTRGGSIGVDVELVDTTMEAVQIALSTFTPREAMIVQSAQSEGQMLAFYRCWTRKEAILKADGRGLTLPLASFEVPLGSAADLGANFQVPIPEGTGDEIKKNNWRYYLQGLEVESGFEAALATRLPLAGIETYRFPSLARLGYAL